MRVTWESSSATAGSWEPQLAYATESSPATAGRAGLLGASLSFLAFVTFLVLAAALAFLVALTSFLPLLAEAATAAIAIAAAAAAVAFTVFLWAHCGGGFCGGRGVSRNCGVGLRLSITTGGLFRLRFGALPGFLPRLLPLLW